MLDAVSWSCKPESHERLEDLAVEFDKGRSKKDMRKPFLSFAAVEDSLRFSNVCLLSLSLFQEGFYYYC